MSKIDYEKNFNCDMYPPLDPKAAKIEAYRCYFCHDAPCIEACPTDIDIPSFIKKIGTGNTKGAAHDILKENIMGGTCARVCPVESLCEGACVRNTSEDKPVEIGLLQKFATDDFFAQNHEMPFSRQKSSGKKVAVVGAGPAGLSCAHRLSTLGHDVVVFEAKEKAGGLNEYGIAAYKMVDDFAQKEVDFILQIGGIDLQYGKKLGENLEISQLEKDYDAVFLAFGLAGVNKLGIPGEERAIDAVDYIAKLRQSKNLAELEFGNKIVVIGGGSTAIDIAVQTKRLGAETVTMVYRKGEENMNATWKERQFAQKNGVLIRNWGQPKEIREGEIEFDRTDGEGSFTLETDMVFKAIGQNLIFDSTDFEKDGKKLAVSENLETSKKGVFAGGDCINNGTDLTVHAVAQGKKAAHSIHQYLGGQ